MSALMPKHSFLNYKFIKDNKVFIRNCYLQLSLLFERDFKKLTEESLGNFVIDFSVTNSPNALLIYDDTP